MKLYALSELIEDNKIGTLAADLISMDDRFRFYKWVGGIQQGKALLFEKSRIIMPFKGPKVQHEISHAVEMNNTNRWIKNDFGLPFDIDITNPRIFFAAMARELRVFAIETRFKDNHSLDLDNFSTLGKFWLIKGAALLPYGRFRNNIDLLNWSQDIMSKTFKRWTEDKIRHEWSIRIDYWKGWMESK